MRYIDLHCDTVTACADRGYSLADCRLHISLQKLTSCKAQCFAIFTDGADAAHKFYKYLDYFEEQKARHNLTQIKCFDDCISCVQSQKTGAILTVENLGFSGGDEGIIRGLCEHGVLMASLVWNNENALAYPNLKMCGGVPDFCASEARGLKDKGRQTVELLDSLKIIVDISHLSDGGTDELLKGRKIPTVASHSNARSVCPVSRNLTDAQIRALADTGGVIGINFCPDFLGGDSIFESILAHIRHIIKTGGEDVIAFGSDFDGIPAPKGLEGCEKMPALITFLESRLPARTVEKLCYKNFMRVLEEVRPHSK